MSRAPFAGRLTAAKPRIGLHRSFDQVWHSYRGYVIVVEGGPRIGVGAGAHAKHHFHPGMTVRGEASPVPEPHTEWATHYKATSLQVVDSGPPGDARPADIDGGVLPPLEELRAHGHRRLDPQTYERCCTRCPFGAVMPTEVIVDQWDPRRTTWGTETHCYGPRDCPRYRAGRPRRVPGRKPGMVYVDET